MRYKAEIKEEILYDFSIKKPRVLISGRTAILDNVKSVEMLSPEQVIVKCGKKHMAVIGQNMLISELIDERMLITGEIYRVEFY